MRRLLFAGFSVACCLCATGVAPGETAPNDAMTLWYRSPAAKWTEALPVGNGRLGAMVFGRTGRERIQLNEDTIWTGGPLAPLAPSDGPKRLPEIQRLVFADKWKQAQDLFDQSMNQKIWFKKYQPLGDLTLEFPGHDNPADYRRSLDLDSAIATVAYQVAQTRFVREIFVSPVDQVLVLRLTADKPAAISCTASLSGMTNEKWPDGEYYTTQGLRPNEIVLDGKTGAAGCRQRIEFQGRLRVTAQGGSVRVTGDRLIVKDADSVTMLFAAATNHVNYKDLSGNPEKRTRHWLHRVMAKSYENLRADHVREHQRLFRRVRLDLGSTPAAKLPTDERIAGFLNADDPQLVALFFQFGRYVLISCSRPGSEPANLQGLWNEDMNPAWDAKYTTNINQQMQYWAAKTTNISECFEPQIRLTTELADTGAQVARTCYGAGGWTLGFNTDLWRQAAVYSDISTGWAFWTTWQAGGAWLCTQLWDHYLFNGDEEYLRQVYPTMKGSAQFFLDTLVEHPKHKWLVTCPSSSPENCHHLDPKKPAKSWGHNNSICAAPTIDMQILRDLFAQCAEAADILKTDHEFRQQILEARKRLAPMRIGASGQLQEWLDDWQGDEPHHRHLSHLWGLSCSNQITPRGTPELAAAARKALELRGDGPVGRFTGPSFTRAWKVNCWARLGDGDRARVMLKKLIGETIFPNFFGSCWDQTKLLVDGNEGGTAGIAEMLLQSHTGELELLPALPRAWPEGSVKGLRARGGFEVDLHWKQGRLTECKIKSLRGAECKVRYRNKTTTVPTKAGDTFTLNNDLK